MQLVNKWLLYSWQTKKLSDHIDEFPDRTNRGEAEFRAKTTPPPALNLTGIWSKLIRDRWSSCAICILLKRGSKMGLCASWENSEAFQLEQVNMLWISAWMPNLTTSQSIIDLWTWPYPPLYVGTPFYSLQCVCVFVVTIHSSSCGFRKDIGGCLSDLKGLQWPCAYRDTGYRLFSPERVGGCSQTCSLHLIGKLKNKFLLLSIG